MSNSPVILALTEAGYRLGERLQRARPDMELRGLKKRIPNAAQVFEDSLAEIAAVFTEGRPLVAICAAGIVIRALAELLVDKTKEPAVLALAEDGSSVVPLLGGHRGANDLASELAVLLDGHAALTTTGDLRWGVALDAPPAGWALGNPQDHKAFAAALLAGEQVVLQGGALAQDAEWLTNAKLPLAETGSLTIGLAPCDQRAGPNCLIYHPKRYVLGVGCERDCDPSELSTLVSQCLATTGLSALDLAGVFSIDVKSDEAAVLQLGETLHLPVRFFDAVRLDQEKDRLATPSDVVFREVGCHGVAEGAALAAVGPDGVLSQVKTKSARATCAIAKAPVPLISPLPGRPRGRLVVAGLGPGRAGWRTAEVSEVLARADDLVGYGYYLDLAGPPPAHQRRHDFALGEETTRVRKALALAAEGREVVLLSSGDPGIYAMASLVFEELERPENAAWRRSDIVVMPGISALQAAAARIGAPLGHDFCAISLSDLLTPWQIIEKRLRTAAAGDFVVALYNPVSKRRRTGFEKAMAIFREVRSGATPVVLGRQLGRAEEQLRVMRLDEVSVDEVDMLTLVMVGAEETRTIDRSGAMPWVYTPRGYANKEKTEEGAA